MLRKTWAISEAWEYVKKKSGGQRQGHFLLTAYSTALALVPYSFPRLLNPVKGTKMSTVSSTPRQEGIGGRYLFNLLPSILIQ